MKNRYIFDGFFNFSRSTFCSSIRLFLYVGFPATDSILLSVHLFFVCLNISRLFELIPKPCFCEFWRLFCCRSCCVSWEGIFFWLMFHLIIGGYVRLQEFFVIMLFDIFNERYRMVVSLVQLPRGLFASILWSLDSDQVFTYIEEEGIAIFKGFTILLFVLVICPLAIFFLLS